MNPDIFRKIYERNFWGYGSGEGSLEKNTRGYRVFLQDFLLQNKIRTVVDMGCGDWQFSQFLNWNNIDYKGYDVVPSLVSTNTKEFSSANVSFFLYSGDPKELPDADLLIVKDVLQHLPNQFVLDFIQELKKFKHVLITNCTDPGFNIGVNKDIKEGKFRYLDLRLEPFNLKAELAYAFGETKKWKKLVLYFRP